MIPSAVNRSEDFPSARTITQIGPRPAPNRRGPIKTLFEDYRREPSVPLGGLRSRRAGSVERSASSGPELREPPC
jgi:hypothetical protein